MSMTTTTRQSYTTSFGVTMRRISWQRFWLLRPDLRPVANDNAVDFSQSGRAASVDGDQVELCTHPRRQLAA